MRRALLVCTAIAFATIDLVHKSLSYAEFHHARTPYVTLVMGALIVALVVLVPRLPSNAAAIGAGIACGGALGNLVSLLAWAQGVPDPFVVTGATHGLAFNLADVFAVGGDSILLSVVILLGLRRRTALREPA
ncbi:MAG TPA: signal peptidase II [Gaiellaceae bacterium]|nr:signal peptidase II [Gaiellaceae bacterium]